MWKLSKLTLVFCLFFWVLKTLVRVITFFLVGEALNLRDDLFFPLNAINIYCKGVVGAILFLLATVPKIFLIVLIFFIGLTLVDKRLLGVLLTRHISIGRVNRLILSKVLVLLFSWLILLETLGINLSGT